MHLLALYFNEELHFLLSRLTQVRSELFERAFDGPELASFYAFFAHQLYVCVEFICLYLKTTSLIDYSFKKEVCVSVFFFISFEPTASGSLIRSQISYSILFCY